MPKISPEANIVGFAALAGLLGWVAGKLVSRRIIVPLKIVKIEAGNPERK